MKNVALMFILTLFVFSTRAQDYADRICLARENGQLFLYKYRTLADGGPRGVIDSASRIQIDSTQAANYVAEKIFQVAQSYWISEGRKINLGTYTRKIMELDSLSINEFGKSARSIVRDAAKPEILTYLVEPGKDTLFMWEWRLLKTGAAGIDVQIVEQFSTGGLYIIPHSGNEIVLTIDNVNVIRYPYEGDTRVFLRNQDNGDEWINYNEIGGVAYRLVRSINPRVLQELR